MNIEIKKYVTAEKKVWDGFVNKAKNGLFLFNRDYMEYHEDRFQDFSLMIYCDDQLVALMPAHLKEDVLYSHNGLTYGGIIYDGQISADTVLSIFSTLKIFLISHHIKCFFYKAVPHIFHKIPAEEDLYALFRSGASLYRVDLSSTIDLNNLIGFSAGKNSGLKKAKSNNLQIVLSDNLEFFFDKIVAPVLSAKYDVAPVHSAAEMRLLMERFPEKIKFYAVYLREEILAGVVLYIFDNAVHLQYLFSSKEGQKFRASELLVNFLIEEFQSKKRYLNFGTSTEKEGSFLNSGLLNYKEEFGARAIVNCHYRVDLK